MKTKKILFIGGIKSGKSINAQNYILKHNKLAKSSSKPTYLATTEFVDEEMQKRINTHIESREDKFETIEEPLRLYEIISILDDEVLVECVSMWINNMQYHGFNLEDMSNEMQDILKLDKTIVFVLNDVGSGVIPENKLAREFIDISGKLSQLIAGGCDEVYHTIAGISTRIK